MTVPSNESVGTRQGIAQRTTMALSAPAGITSGECIVLYAFLDSNHGTISATGFTHHPNSPVSIVAGGGNHQMAILERRADGTEGATFTITWDGTNRYCEGQAALYNSVIASGSMFDVAELSDTPTATDLVGSTTSPAVNVTTDGADRLLLHAATNWAGGAWTAGTGFTKRSTGAEDLFFGDKVQAVMGNSGSVTATCAGSDKMTAWIGALIGTTGAAATSSTIRRRPLGALLQL